jgi:SAM-dependent methyltransferase
LTAAPRPEVLDAGPLAELADRLFSADYRRVHAAIDRFCVDLCFQVVDAHGLFRRAETRESLSRVTAVSAPEGAYLMDTVVAILVEEGYLAREGDVIVRAREVPEPDLPALRRDAADRWPEEPFFDLLDRCGRGLPDVLAGRRRGWDVIFPRGDLSLWERLHNTSAVLTPYARLAAAAAAGVVRPEATILELGAGTGAGTACLLRELAGVPVRQYLYSDVGLVFLRVGRRRFGQLPFVEFAEYDLDGPASSTVAPRSLDLVFGVNVLHVARSLPDAVDQLRATLRPGGWIVLGEGSPPGPGRTWRPDLAFGFLDGWWNVPLDARFRPRPGFLRATQWLDLLRSRGFGRVAAIPGEGADGCFGGAIVGQAPDGEA